MIEPMIETKVVPNTNPKTIDDEGHDDDGDVAAEQRGHPALCPQLPRERGDRGAIDGLDERTRIE